MKKLKAISITTAVLVIITCFFVSVSLYQLNGSKTDTHPIAHKGVIDLTSWNPESGELVPLKGEWIFNWQKLINPDSSLSSPKHFINLPGIWNNYQSGDITTTQDGWATYTLFVKLPQPGEYGLRIKELDCAYKIWVNTNFTISSGIVATSKKQEVPSWKRNELLFSTTTNDPIKITLQVSNFNHHKGGAEDVILIGSKNTVRDLKHSIIFLTCIIIGVLIFGSLHYMLIFSLRTKDLTNAIFAILCLLSIVRLGLTGEKFFVDIFPSLSWEFMVRMEYLSFVLFAPMLILLYTKIFPTLFSVLFLRTIEIISGLFCILILFFPVNIFTYTPYFFEWVIAIGGLYTLLKLSQAVLEERESALILFIGFLCFITGVTNDLLHYNNLIHSAYLTPVGFLALILSQGFALSTKNALAHQKIEKLSKVVNEHNQLLETKVEARTKELQQQKEKLEATNKDLKQLTLFKEEMTNMIIHDLKNPLNTIINIVSLPDINEFKNLIETSGRTMLRLIMNTLDIYKLNESELELNKSNFTANEIITEAITETSYQASVNKVEIIIEPQNTDLTINGDKELLLRTITNILVNAIKHSPQESTITIYCLIKHSNIEVHIKDQGIGIPIENQKLIFDKFHSKKTSNQQTYSTGLGLTFCKLAMEAHQGSINVISEYKKGADFFISLPYSKDL